MPSISSVSFANVANNPSLAPTRKTAPASLVRAATRQAHLDARFATNPLSVVARLWRDRLTIQNALPVVAAERSSPEITSVMVMANICAWLATKHRHLCAWVVSCPSWKTASQRKSNTTIASASSAMLAQGCSRVLSTQKMEKSFVSIVTKRRTLRKGATLAHAQSVALAWKWRVSAFILDASVVIHAKTGWRATS